MVPASHRRMRPRRPRLAYGAAGEQPPVRQLQAVYRLLRNVTLPSLRRHRLRAALTLLGVVTGTQVVVAIALINRSVLTSFTHTLETIAGGADLQITDPAAGVPEDLVGRVAELPGVAVAEGLVLGTLQTAHGDLTVLGVDLFADQTLREIQVPRRHVHIPDPLRFANATDSIAPSTSFAARAGLDLGAVLEASGPTGGVSLTVRGLVDPVGPAALFGGAVALADLPAAQRLFRRADRVDQINVKLVPGADRAQVEARLVALVGTAASVEPPRERGASLGTMLASVQTLLSLASLNALVVGFFIIYHTLSSAIAQRRRELALARALGYRRRTLVAAVVCEALAFGAAGALIGAMLGTLAASLSLDALTASVGTLYARIDRPEIALAAGDLALALALGVASALGGALVPALTAARLSVVEHLRTGPASLEPEARGSGRPLAGLALTAAGYAVCLLDLRPAAPGARVALIMAGSVLVAIGYAVLAPVVAGWLARRLGQVARRRGLTTAALALRGVARQPEKSRGTIAALMVAFALVLLVGTYVRGFRSSIATWLDQVFAADLFITAGSPLPSPAGIAMPGELEDLLRATDGVAEVSATQMLTVPLAGRMVLLKTDSGRAFDRMRYPVVACDAAGCLEAFRAGRGVLVSDNLAFQAGIRAGDEITLPAPGGPRRFRVSAVVTDYTRDSGTVIVEREAYRRIWRDDRAQLFLVWAAPGVDAETLRATIRARLAGRASVLILTAGEYKTSVREALDQALLLPYAMQLVAIAVAVIGVMSFFLAEAVDRKREMGLLRSVALTRRQLMRTLAAEAAFIGALGGVAAVAYGAPLSFLIVTRWQRVVSGWTLTFDFPLALAAASVLVAAAVAVLAASYPVRRAAAQPLVDLVASE
jgi:putative ABC transport system permease protein